MAFVGVVFDLCKIPWLSEVEELLVLPDLDELSGFVLLVVACLDKGWVVHFEHAVAAILVLLPLPKADATVLLLHLRVALHVFIIFGND